MTRTASDTTPVLRALRTLRRALPYWKSTDGYKWSTKLADASIAFRAHEKWLEEEILVPGECFIDVGAHVGKYAIRASKLYRQVVAFEPNPKTCKILRANVALNKVRNVRVYQIALSNKTGSSLLFEGKRPASSGLNQPVREYLKGTSIEVRTETLDRLMIRPSLIKIDTEGHELQVLEGSIEALKRYHPRLIIEVHRLDFLDPLKKLLITCGYTEFKIPRKAETIYHQSYLVAN